MNKFELMKQQLKGGVQVVSAPQLFPTPQPVIDLMIEKADIYSSHTVLEPSAGTGAIMREVLPLCMTVKGIELNFDLAHALQKRGFDVECRDFLEYRPSEKFGRILMNPPFEKGQDIDHVLHAFNNCLEEGGRLVAIMCAGPFFRQDKKSTAFREWFDYLGAEVEDLPPNSFEQSGTGVNTKIVTIDKD